MKILIVFFILMYAFFPKSFAHSDDIELIEAFQTCVEDCVTFEEPGYALKACIEECKKHYGISEGNQGPLYCNTDEEDCDRDEESGI